MNVIISQWKIPGSLRFRVVTGWVTWMSQLRSVDFFTHSVDYMLKSENMDASEVWLDHASPTDSRMKRWQFWTDSMGSHFVTLRVNRDKPTKEMSSIINIINLVSSLTCWYMVMLLTHKMAFMRKALRMFGGAMRTNRTSRRIHMNQHSLSGSNLQVKPCD